MQSDPNKKTDSECVSLKTIGILGGLSPESTVYYYQYITRQYTERFGDHGYPEIMIYSVRFQDYIDWGNSNDWAAVEEDIVAKLNALDRAGAGFAVVATNTMHYLFDAVTARVEIPILSIVDAVRDDAVKHGLKTLGLLGTKITMTKDFYPKALAQAGIDTIVPDPADQEIIHEILFTELTNGILKNGSKKRYLDIIRTLAENGADGVILGCTEIPLLIKPEDVDIHVLDSSLIHADAALNYALD